MTETTRTPGGLRPAHRPASVLAAALTLLALLALLAAGLPAQAAEGYRLRQPPLSLLGAEIAARPENPGLFATALLSDTRIGRVADEAGRDIVLPARTDPLPTGAPTGGRVPDGTYALATPAAAVDFHQTQRQINLVAGFAAVAGESAGRWVFAANLPLIRQQRSVSVAAEDGVVSPVPPATVPAALRGAITAVGTAARSKVAASLATFVDAQNQTVSGVGDLELSGAWVRHDGPMRVVVGMSAFLPTGAYDVNRGPNPGFGRFYTLRPSAGLSYGFDEPGSAARGLTVAGRIGWGFNTRNRDSDYRTGNFLSLEGAVVKVVGDWGFGVNWIGIHQLTDDSGPGVPADGRRYRNSAMGPFVAWKFNGSDAGLNLHWSRNFASRNALVSETVQLRFVRVW